MQVNKVKLDECEENKVAEYIDRKISYENFDMYYMLQKLFCSSAKDVLKYIDCCFTMISKSDKFLNLDIKLIKKILLSSSLSVTSEIQVFNAADAWLGHHFLEREKFATDLLLTLRFPLVPNSALDLVLQKSSSFRRNLGSLALVNEILQRNNDFYNEKSSMYFTHRYCEHKKCNIFVGGGKHDNVCINAIQVMNSGNLNRSKTVSSLVKPRYGSNIVYSEGNIFVFGGIDDTPPNTNSSSIYKIITEVEKYSHVTNTSEKVADIRSINEHELGAYCVCNYIDKIYMFGGYDDSEAIADYCFEFDTNNYSWKENSRMNEMRENPAAVVFEERIIVSGGLQYVDEEEREGENYYDDLRSGLEAGKTVEAYEPLIDTWSSFPSMIHGRCCHKSVAVKNKLFVIGGGTQQCEVYDSTSNKFVALKRAFNFTKLKRLNSPIAVVTVGYKIFIFDNKSSYVLCYDLEENKWTKKSCEATTDLELYSCVKVPRL